jgi:hypothetical protein
MSAHSTARRANYFTPRRNLSRSGNHPVDLVTLTRELPAADRAALASDGTARGGDLPAGLTTLAREP